MTYADKYDRYRYSIYRFYRDIRRKVDVNFRIGRFYPNVLDHVVLDDGDVDAKLIEEVAQSHLVDDAAASIQRFASRCLAADKSEMMVMMISQAIRSDNPLPKPIIDVLLFYGAKLDPRGENYIYTACLFGMNDVMQQAIENGYEVGEYDVRAALESGNCDTIKLVFSAYRGSIDKIVPLSARFDPFDLLNATVQSMELCLSLNIIQHGKHHYSFRKIPSFSVLQWILDHDVMEHDRLLIDIASNASCYSGHYFDMLRYLIEQRNFTVPRDILLQLYLSQATDSDVFDYLLSHGADVNAVNEGGWNVLEHFPMLIRYCIDKGLKLKPDDATVMIDCIHHGMTAPVLEMMIEKYELNVNVCEEYGYTALREACVREGFELVEMLLCHGADVNKHGVDGQTPYDYVHNDRIKQLLASI